MKILQLNKYFYQKGGAETVFFNTISTLENRGHQVIPFALKNKKNKFSEYESYFVDYPELSESNIWTKITNIPSFIYNRQAAKQLERLILDKKPDIAHIQTQSAGILKARPSHPERLQPRQQSIAEDT